MKRNIFKLFLNKFLSYPIWVKQVVYYYLWKDMCKNGCEQTVTNNPNKILTLNVPVLTFKGKEELSDKKSGYDSNIYNFLKYSYGGYTVLEIALNMFLSVEEIAKLYIFCLDQKLIAPPEATEVVAMAEFIAGKIRIGEYFVNIGVISEEQLQFALEEQKALNVGTNNVLLGGVLIKKGYLQELTINNLFKLKTDSSKRFVINPEQIPDENTDINVTDKLEAVNKQLAKENQALKKAMTAIINTVKDYDI